MQGQCARGSLVLNWACRVPQGHIRAGSQRKERTVGLGCGQSMAVQVQGEGHRRNQYRLGKVCHQMNGRPGGHRVVLQCGHRLGKGVKVDILFRRDFHRLAVLAVAHGDVVRHCVLGACRGKNYIGRRKAVCRCEMNSAAVLIPAQCRA